MYPIGARVVRILVGFVLAASAGYVIAILFATLANLMRLSDIGAQISFADAWRTYVFDLFGMAPTPFEITRYGTVIFIGLAIAFPVAALLRGLAARGRPPLQRIVPFLFPAAGATAIGVSLVLMYQRYEVSAVAGGRGFGFLAQCVAGGIAGFLFQLVLRKFKARQGPVLLNVVLLLAGVAFAETSSAQTLQVDVLADKLDGPWGLAFLPDGRMLLSERSGALLLLDAQGSRLARIANVPEAFVKLQGGLFDVALHPQFERNSLIYLSLAHGRQKHNTTRVVRAVLKDQSLENVEVIFDTTVKGTSVHYGGRLAFMRDGKLLVTTGEGAEYREDAQRLDSLLGKVVRINDDGTIPADNPFVGRPGAEAAIWSYGHRSPQGLYVDPETDAIYLTEHGPRGGDEINVITRGSNYGWPIATHGIDYTGGRISPFETYPGMREPLVFWTPSIAPGGIVLYRGAMFPEWQGDLIVAVLGHTHLRRVDMQDGRVVAQYPLLGDRQARFRQVEIGPEGALYALVEAVAGADRSGQLLRISARDHNPAATSRRSELLSEAGARSPPRDDRASVGAMRTPPL